MKPRKVKPRIVGVKGPCVYIDLGHWPLAWPTLPLPSASQAPGLPLSLARETLASLTWGHTLPAVALLPVRVL